MFLIFFSIFESVVHLVLLDLLCTYATFYICENVVGHGRFMCLYVEAFHFYSENVEGHV